MPLVDDQPLSTGVSCGVASTDSLAGDRSRRPLRLFRLADAAQYRAKRSGCPAGRSSPGSAGADVARGVAVDRRARRGRLARRRPGRSRVRLRGARRAAGWSVQTRLEALADHVLLLLDGAAWWVSRRLATTGHAGQREQLGAALRRPNLDANGIAQPRSGRSLRLDDFPASRARDRDAARLPRRARRWPEQRPGRGAVARHRGLHLLWRRARPAPARAGWSRSTATRSACRSPASSRCCGRS